MCPSGGTDGVDDSIAELRPVVTFRRAELQFGRPARTSPDEHPSARCIGAHAWGGDVR